MPRDRMIVAIALAVTAGMAMYPPWIVGESAAPRSSYNWIFRGAVAIDHFEEVPLAPLRSKREVLAEHLGHDIEPDVTEAQAERMLLVARLMATQGGKPLPAGAYATKTETKKKLVDRRWIGRIDLTRLGLQLVLVWALAGAAFVLARK